jgi:5-methylthioadenosine/S-adenosylhomocysteine deaminase
MAGTLLLQARWVVPVEPHGAVLADHAVAVRDGRIEAVLPRAAAEARFADAQRVDLGEHALVPGLVNAHTHAAMALMRGIADDMTLMSWLENTSGQPKRGMSRRNSSRTERCSPVPRCCAAA